MKNLPTPEHGEHHRTAIIIDVRLGVSANYRERYMRLIQTFNHPNAMKVDWYTLGSNAEHNGPGLVQCLPHEYVCPDQPPQVLDLQAWADEVGYQLTIYICPTPKECK